jgi:hypothetical protein
MESKVSVRVIYTSNKLSADYVQVWDGKYTKKLKL